MSPENVENFVEMQNFVNSPSKKKKNVWERNKI